MGFGDILDQWDTQTAKAVGKKALRAMERAAEEQPPAAEAGESPDRPRVDPMTAWLRRNPVVDKDDLASVDESFSTGAERAERRRRLRAKLPDAVVDLHGLTRDEAWARLSAFFADSRRQGLEKVQIVHGKGNHSEGEAILKRITKEFIERCRYAGESGPAENRWGGNGATWVLLKRG